MKVTINKLQKALNILTNLILQKKKIYQMKNYNQANKNEKKSTNKADQFSSIVKVHH